MQKRILIVIVLVSVSLFGSSSGFCGGIPVIDSTNYLQALISYAKDLEEYLSIVNVEWATVEKYRKELQKTRRQIQTYQRMLRDAERISTLIKAEEWKSAAKGTKQLYNRGMKEFFDKDPSRPVDLEELLKTGFYVPKDPDQTIDDVASSGIDSERENRNINFDDSQIKAYENRVRFTAGSQSESIKRREDIIPRFEDMVEDLDDEEKAEERLIAKQNLIVMRQLQDLIDTQNEWLLNAGAEEAKRASENAEFIDHQTKRLEERNASGRYQWDGERIGEL